MLNSTKNGNYCCKKMCADIFLYRKQLTPYDFTLNNLNSNVILTPNNDSALSDTEYARLSLLLCSEEGAYISEIAMLVACIMHFQY